MQLILWFLVLANIAYASANYQRDESSSNTQTQSPLMTEFEWKYFDYVWKSPDQKDEYQKSGKYNPNNMISIDVDRSTDGRTFVTIIGDPGVPARVNTVSNERGPSGPLLEPYPDWSWYENDTNCDNIMSVYRVAIDKCNRIWMMDAGKIGPQMQCPAKLLAFDLSNNALLFKIDIPNDAAKNAKGNGYLITPIVETYGEKCENTTVYMADSSGHALVIWNGQKAFRIEDDVFAPEEKNMNLTIAGQNLSLSDGVLGMALSPIQNADESRYLYFRPLASKSMYAAETRVLRSYTNGNKIEYKRGIDVLPSQAVAQAFSSEGILFFGLTQEIAIGCWNMNKPLEKEYFKIAVQDTERLQFASGMKVISNENEYVLTMTNRLQKLFFQKKNFNETNFRILKASVKDLIQNGACNN